MTQEAKVLDRNTVVKTLELDSLFPSSQMKSRLVRIFNFKARQVITLHEQGFSHAYSGESPALSSAMEVRNFRDFESRAEIEEAHAELVARGYNPEPLDAGVIMNKNTLVRKPAA